MLKATGESSNPFLPRKMANTPVAGLGHRKYYVHVHLKITRKRLQTLLLQAQLQVKIIATSLLQAQAVEGNYIHQRITISKNWQIPVTGLGRRENFIY